MAVCELDMRLMAAAIRLSRWNTARTGSNPSVATLIVRKEGDVPVIVGRGITAIGGRPHAEAAALAEAGAAARGATAYVTLEPCAHHGRTPPCAEALTTAGVSRVVAAATDPDPRVSGRGYAMLRAAGIEVDAGVLADEAARAMAGYLMQRTKNRPYVTLKMAVSSDGFVGRRDGPRVLLTGPEASAQVHALRARSHAVLIGIGTALADDPQLTCRLPGLAGRSPARVVLDRRLRLPLSSKLVAGAKHTRLIVATPSAPDAPQWQRLQSEGITFVATVDHAGRIALPELLDDLAARGIQSLMVEGGAKVAESFLADDLVDRIALYTAPGAIASADAIAAPIRRDAIPGGFRHRRTMTFGADLYDEYERGER